MIFYLLPGRYVASYDETDVGVIFHFFSYFFHVANGNRTEIADVIVSSLVNSNKNTECLTEKNIQSA